MYALEVYRQLDRYRRVQLRREASVARLQGRRARVGGGRVDLYSLRLGGALVAAGEKLRQRKGWIDDVSPKGEAARLR